VIVIDNASRDGTSATVRDRYPGADLVTLRRNRGAAARNVGAARAATRYVAFSDDDSWWEPGSLGRAVAVLDGNPRVGLVAARTLVGAAGVPDPVNAVMKASPLPSGQLPGPRVLGFLGCAAVVRRAAFLAVGGFSELLFFGCEEQLLAMDLAAAGWPAAYLDEVIARHWPSAARDDAARRRLMLRNEVLIAWLRRPARIAVTATADLALRLGRDPAAARAIPSLLRAWPRALRQRCRSVAAGRSPSIRGNRSPDPTQRLPTPHWTHSRRWVVVADYPEAGEVVSPRRHLVALHDVATAVSGTHAGPPVDRPSWASPLLTVIISSTSLPSRDPHRAVPGWHHRSRRLAGAKRGASVMAARMPAPSTRPADR
jgi:cellulose synthase/poly-beta-1,6-N-acetylglucosamine synthase-like glycosyltransferase